MKKHLRKLFAVLLSVMLIVSVFPGAFAETQNLADVANVNNVNYATLAEAVSAAQNGETIRVIADISDEAVTVNKNLTITGTATLNNVSITMSGTTVELTVSGLNFTGSSYINANNGAALTVTDVTATVAPTKLSGRAAFIVAGTSELSHGLKLVVKNNVIKSAQSKTDFYSAAIFGWRYINDGSEISGNTFGAEDNRYTFIGVKLMNAIDDAKITIANNKIYGTSESYVLLAFDLYQNCSRANAYTVVSKNNTINATIGNSYPVIAFCLEGNTGFSDATNVTLIDNGTTLNGNPITLSDIDVSDVGSDYDKYFGVDVVTDVNGKIISGTFGGDMDTLAENIADGYEVVNGVVSAAKNYVAEVDGVKYETLAAAVAAAQNGDVITMLQNVELSTGVTVPAGLTVTLELNGKTISRTTDAAQGSAAITNKGNLTIQDSVGGGKVSSFAGNPDNGAFPGYANNTITNKGTLTIKSGTIENATEYGKAAFPIDNYSYDSDAYLYIEGGVITGRGAIRQYAPYTNYKNEVYIKSGTVTGTSYALWVQNLESGNPSAKTVISGGELSRVLLSPSTNFDVSITGGKISTVEIWEADETNPSRNPAGFISGGTFSADVSEFVADGFTCEEGSDGSFGIKEGLAGMGTEANPYVINTKADLFFFAENVNNGTYKNVYVVLGADIDLEEDDWTPIGTSSNPFLGVFDGKGHTISNVWCTPDSGAAGLFGQVGTQNERIDGTVKNLIVENITLIAIGQNSAGVIAVGPLGAYVYNVKLIGEVTIQGYRGVGGIVGNGFPTIDSCSVEAEGAINATYWGAGGILGFTNDYGAKVTNVSVKGVGDGLEVYGDLGGVGGVTGTPYGAATNGATVSNVTVSSTSNFYMAYVDASGSVANAVVENVAVKVNGQDIIGNDAVCTVDGTPYFDFAQAVAAAQNGDVITMLQNVELSTGVTVPAGLTVTLELNGKTISRTTDAAQGSAAITNKGNLTIQDSVGGGKVSSFAGNPDNGAFPGYANNTITNMGTLTIKSGTIENATEQGKAAFPIDNYSYGSDAYLYIEGGVITGRGAIRQYAPNNNYKNEVYIKGGTITGTSYALWVQNLESGNPSAKTVISGGELSRVLLSPSTNFDVSITGGKISTVEIWEADETNPSRNPAGFISGGTFNTPVAEEYCAEGFIPESNGDGTYGVKVGKYIAQIEDSKYESLRDALAEAQNGDVIKLLDNVYEPTMSVILEENIILDVQGYTLTVARLTCYEGAYVIGASYNKKGTGYGKVVVPKNRFLAESESAYLEHLALGDYYVLPVWDDDNDCYIFGRYYITENFTGGGLAIDEANNKFTLYFQPQGSGAVIDDFFADGVLDNNVEIIIRISWISADGDEVVQDYKYGTEMIMAWTQGRGLGITFTGYQECTNISATAMVVSGTGVTIYGETHTINTQN